MAALAAYAWTDAGRKMLRDNVRWDESKKAFIVTFYKDGEKKEIEVNDYYTEGNGSGTPDLFNVYERAYGKLIGNDDLPDGYSKDAMQDLSGKKVRNLNTFGGSGFLGWPWWDDDKYTDGQWKQIEEAVDSHQPVTASSDGGKTITARVDTNGDGNVDGTDAEGKYQIVDGHEYAVIDIDDQYVTLYNPWGGNDDSSGDRINGGKIRITRNDYQTYFNETHIGQIS